ncbi:MAG: DUF1761 domain-containing protein [Saprospiraceae bacterium]|jgi:hypothetical protein
MKTNYLAILACAVINMLLGMGWYGVFAKPWMEGHGLSPEDAENMSGMNYGVSIGAALVAALIVSMIWRRMGVCTWADGLKSGAALGVLGLVGTIVGYMFAQINFETSMIDGGFAFIQMTLFGLVLGGWVKK